MLIKKVRENRGGRNNLTHKSSTGVGARQAVQKVPLGNSSSHSRSWHTCRPRATRQRSMLREISVGEGTNCSCTELLRTSCPRRVRQDTPRRARLRTTSSPRRSTEEGGEGNVEKEHDGAGGSDERWGELKAGSSLCLPSCLASCRPIASRARSAWEGKRSVRESVELCQRTGRW